MNKKTYRRKTYKRKTYKRKTYKRKRGGNLNKFGKFGAEAGVKIGQTLLTKPIATRPLTNGNIGKNVISGTQDFLFETGKGLVQKNTQPGIKYVANNDSTQRLPTIPLSSGMGYYPPTATSSPTNNYKFAPPPPTEIP